MYEFMKNKLSDLFFTFSLLQHIIVNLICKLTFNIYYHNTIKGVKNTFLKNIKQVPTQSQPKIKRPLNITFKERFIKYFIKIVY